MSATRNTALGVGAALFFLLASGGRPDVLFPGADPVDPNAAFDAWLACRSVKPQTKECATLRTVAIDLLREDFRTLGAGGNFAPLPVLLSALKGPEPELRAAAADGIGMIGPRATETAALAAAFDDPVPAVRASAMLALGASADERAKALSGRALNAGRWKGFEPEKAPDLAKLAVPLYAGATPLRFATDLQGGRAQVVTSDPPEKVIAFYSGRAKRQPMALAEFEAAFSGEAPPEPEREKLPGGGEMPNADDFAKAMAMMQQMNEATNSGKTVEQAAADMGGAQTSAQSAASDYADDTIYGAPRVIVLEENDVFGVLKPVRYVVVYRDLVLGKTGIAFHTPPVI